MTINRDKCITGKAIFASESEIRKSLVGQLGTKRIRTYICPECHGFHMTKEKTTNRQHKLDSAFKRKRSAYAMEDEGYTNRRNRSAY